MIEARFNSKNKERVNLLPICNKDKYPITPDSSHATDTVSLKWMLFLLAWVFNAAFAMDIPPQPGEYRYDLCQPSLITSEIARECTLWQEGQWMGFYGPVSCANPKLPFPWDSETLLLPKASIFFGGGPATGKGWQAPGQTLPYNGCWQGPPSYTYGIETSNVQKIEVAGSNGSTWSATARRSRTVSCDSAYYDTLPNGACRLKGADPGKNNDICLAGDNGSNPIHSAVGAKLQQEVDYAGNFSNPLRLVRLYTSAKRWDQAGLGRHWQHNYARKIVFVESMLVSASVTRESGHRFHFNFDYVFDLVRNLETSRTEGLTAAGASTPETRTIETEWHSIFRRPVRIAEPGLEAVITYDDKGRIIHASRKDLASNTTREWHTAYTYSATVPGAVVQKVEDGPRADVSDLITHDYYPPDEDCTGGHLGCRGQLKQIASALGHVARITRYSAHGRPEEIIDPNGRVTILAYDARQRLISSDIGGEVTAYQHDPAGQMTRITELSGAYLAYRYDEAHRLIEIKDHQSNTLSYNLGAKGNRLREDISDPMGRLVRRRERIYDVLSRLQNTVQAQ
jgi:YD repeat-containing protein